MPFAEQTERMPRNRPVAMAAVYYRTYATKDAALAVACGSPSLRRKFIAAVGHADPALAGQVADVDAHYAKLKKAVEATVAGRTTEEWQSLMASAGVPASRVALPLEILDDDQPAANAMFSRHEHPALGPVTVLGPPLRLDERRLRRRAANTAVRQRGARDPRVGRLRSTRGRSPDRRRRGEPVGRAEARSAPEPRWLAVSLPARSTSRYSPLAVIGPCALQRAR